MPKNFNDGVTAAWTAALAALPTAGKLYAWLSDEPEGSIAVTDTIVGGHPVRTAGTAVIPITGITCVARIMDIILAKGGPLQWTESGAGVQPCAVVLSTKDPTVTADATNKLWAIQNITDGTPHDTTVLGPVVMTALALKDAYEAEP